MTASLQNLNYLTSVNTSAIANLMMADGGLNLLVSIVKRLGRRINGASEDGLYQPSSLTRDIVKVLPSVHGQPLEPFGISVNPIVADDEKTLRPAESSASLAGLSASSLASSLDDLRMVGDIAAAAASSSSRTVINPVLQSHSSAPVLPSSSSTSATDINPSLPLEQQAQASLSSSTTSSSSSSSSSISPSSSVSISPTTLSLLESRLQQRLSYRQSKTDNMDRFAFTQALQALANIATRGRQRAKEALAESGIIPVLVELLEESVSIMEVVQELQAFYAQHPGMAQTAASVSMAAAGGVFVPSTTLDGQPQQTQQVVDVVMDTVFGGQQPQRLPTVEEGGVGQMDLEQAGEMEERVRRMMDGPMNGPEDQEMAVVDSSAALPVFDVSAGAPFNLTDAHISAAAEPMSIAPAPPTAALNNDANTNDTTNSFGLNPHPDVLDQTFDNMIAGEAQRRRRAASRSQNMGDGDEFVDETAMSLLTQEPSEPPRAAYSFSAAAGEPSLSDLIRESNEVALAGLENAAANRRRGSVDVGGQGALNATVGMRGTPLQTPTGAMPQPSPRLGAAGIPVVQALTPTLPNAPLLPTTTTIPAAVNNNINAPNPTTLPMYSYPVAAHDPPLLPGIRYLPRTPLESNLISEILSRGTDILCAAKIIASLSKYPSMRIYLHADNSRPRRPPKSCTVPSRKLKKFAAQASATTGDVESSMSEGTTPGQRKEGEGGIRMDVEEEELDEEDEDLEYMFDAFNPRSAFELIEFFTGSSSLIPEARMWAVMALRNAYRRDPSSPVAFGPDGEVISVSAGQLRRCAYSRCGKWEERFKQFSKCSRCRRVTYCCKSCQRRAWVLHKNWCLKFNGDSSASRDSTSHHHQHHHQSQDQQQQQQQDPENPAPITTATNIDPAFMQS
ncbi:hypothetical protein HDV05_004075 [Chytridiales sp. JEL 0842]|nr:hypothetical protein HDV05_004075 [Chytridiales sp. JEL 0842]